MHRFFISQSDHVDDSRALICSDDLIHQFTKVLRFKSGEKVILLDNSGYWFLVELQNFDSGKITGKVLEKRFCNTELPVRLVIALAILKNMERFEWALQKGTELGVSAFVPLVTDRTERKVLGKVERLQRILKESAEQSGRGKVPELLEAGKFEKIFEGNEGQFVLALHPGAEQTFSNFCKENLIKKEDGIFFGNLIVCVGPEGGFTDREIEILKKEKAQVVSLGERILRAETVPVVVSVLVNQFLGRL